MRPGCLWDQDNGSVCFQFCISHLVMISGALDHAFWVLVKHFSVRRWAASDIRRKVGLVVCMLCGSRLVSSTVINIAFRRW